MALWVQHSQGKPQSCLVLRPKISWYWRGDDFSLSRDLERPVDQSME